MRINKTSLIVLVLATLSLISTISAQEACPTIIGWKIVDDTCVSDTGCDYDLSGNTTYYSTEYMCLAILSGNYKYCEVDQDCKSLNGCDAGCWNTDYEPPNRTGGICPTLSGPESCKCYQNECTPACSVDSDCVDFYVECEEGRTLTCQNSLCLCQRISTHEGDGTYVLNVGDSIEASNGYLVELISALGEFGSRSDWRTDFNIYDPNGELIKNHISWGNGTIDIDHMTIKYERYEEGKATVTVTSYDVTTTTIPITSTTTSLITTTSTIPSEAPIKFERLNFVILCLIIIILITILLKMKK